jgi:hypothetical protein
MKEPSSCYHVVVITHRFQPIMTRFVTQKLVTQKLVTIKLPPTSDGPSRGLRSDARRTTHDARRTTHQGVSVYVVW